MTEQFGSANWHLKRLPRELVDKLFSSILDRLEKRENGSPNQQISVNRRAVEKE
jgi:hypothetical protein